MNSKGQIKVRLSPEEFVEAADGGFARAKHAYLKNWQRKKSDPTYGRWEDSIRGAIGEMAVCHHYGFAWNATVGQTDAKDAGPYQVRSTWRVNGKLILQEDEMTSTDLFVFVTGDGLDYILRGWMMPKAAAVHPEWRQDFNDKTNLPEVTYRVPQSALWPMEDLPPASPEYFRAQKVVNIGTPNFNTFSNTFSNTGSTLNDVAGFADRAKLAAALATDPEIRLCPVCWGPERIDPKTGRVYPPEHDAHKHAFALARG